MSGGTCPRPLANISLLVAYTRVHFSVEFEGLLLSVKDQFEIYEAHIFYLAWLSKDMQVILPI